MTTLGQGGSGLLRQMTPCENARLNTPLVTGVPHLSETEVDVAEARVTGPDTGSTNHIGGLQDLSLCVISQSPETLFVGSHELTLFKQGQGAQRENNARQSTYIPCSVCTLDNASTAECKTT